MLWQDLTKECMSKIAKLIESQRPTYPLSPGCLVSIFGLSKDYNRAVKEYEIAKKNYPKLLSEYKSKREQIFSVYIKPSRHPDKANELLESAFKRALIARIEYKTKKGVIEEKFYDTLKQHFGDKIFIDRIIEITEDGNPYVPDIIYYDENTNINIDIEVDEPYTLEEGKPIHYNYLEDGLTSVDFHRDFYFRSNGWIILRFSKEQIVKDDLACCNVLARLISIISGDNSYIKFLPETKEIKQEKAWTLIDSINYEKSGFREKYLKIERVRKNYKMSKKEQFFYDYQLRRFTLLSNNTCIRIIFIEIYKKEI